MEINKFPNDYENDQMTKANSLIDEANAHFEKQVNTLCSRTPKEPKISEHIIVSIYVGFIIGVILGFKSCFGPSPSALRFFGTIFLATAIFAVIGAIVGVADKKNYEQSDQSVRSQIDQEREQTGKNINNIKDRYRKPANGVTA